MKYLPSPKYSGSRRWPHQDQNELKTLWLANGKSVDAVVMRVGFDGIQVSISDVAGFIKASELCTTDRVRYGFATRKEHEWMAKMNANAAAQTAVENKGERNE